MKPNEIIWYFKTLVSMTEFSNAIVGVDFRDSESVGSELNIVF